MTDQVGRTIRLYRIPCASCGRPALLWDITLGLTWHQPASGYGAVGPAPCPTRLPVPAQRPTP